MASIKQLNMLSAKARAAHLDFDREASKDIDNGEIDALVKKFDARGGKQAVEQKKDAAPKEPEINLIRFGLACKLVIQQAGYEWVIDSPAQFTTRVKNLYGVLNQAEEAVSASSGGN